MEGIIIISVVIVWMACAFGCAAIAKSKNKSALGWFLLGLLLGIIGILIIGFMEKEEPGSPHSWKYWALAVPAIPILIALLFFAFMGYTQSSVKIDLSLSEVAKQIERGNVEQIVVSDNDLTIHFRPGAPYKLGTTVKWSTSNGPEVFEAMGVSEQAIEAVQWEVE